MKYLRLLLLISLIVTFTLTAINIKSYPNEYEKVGEEPSETISPADLDIIKLYVKHDDTYIYFNISVASDITTPTLGYKRWIIHMDVDCNSLNTSNFDYYDSEYDITIILYDNGSYHVDGGEYSSGGPGKSYWEIKVNRTGISGLGDVFLIRLEAQKYYPETGTVISADKVPEDGAGEDRCGDFWIYYISPPTIPPGDTWAVEILDNISDIPAGEELYFDIHYLREDCDDNNLYFQIEVGANIPWNGGWSKANYQIYIDVDDDGGDPSHCYADYKLELCVGYAVRLYYYSGGDWVPLKRELWPHAPSLGKKLTIISPISHYTSKSLGGTIRITCDTWEDGNHMDSAGACEPAPVPELSILSLLILCIVVLRIFYVKN